MSAAEDFLNKWMPLKEVQKILNYKPTQMAAFLKNKALKVARIGNNKFVNRDSLDQLMEQSCETQPLGE